MKRTKRDPRLAPVGMTTLALVAKLQFVDVLELPVEVQMTVRIGVCLRRSVGFWRGNEGNFSHWIKAFVSESERILRGNAFRQGFIATI